MSDPRGHGFRKGKGKWHAPRHQTQGQINPCDLGWSQVDSEQKWYIGSQLLELAPDRPGFVLVQRAVIAGIERVGRLFVGNGLLAQITNDILKDEAD